MERLTGPDYIKSVGSADSGFNQQEFSCDTILKMSPKELADFFSKLQDKNELKTFLEKAIENESLSAMFSYWEKWLTKDQRKLIDQIIAKKTEIYGENSETIPLDLEKKFTPPELHLILSNLEAIQLTFGCSKGCPFCGFDAVPGVREHIPYNQLVNLFKRYGSFIKQSQPILYYASDPFDFGVGDKTYEDVHQLAEGYADYSPTISSTKINNKEWLQFLGVKGKAQVSVYGLSARKIEKLKKKLSGKVYLVGQGKSHRQGIGVSGLKNQNYRTGELGIGCDHGILLTPRGLYNLVQLPISKDFPQGQIVAPLEKISDTEIKEGDLLKNVLQESIVKHETHQYYSWRRLQIFRKDGNYSIEFDEKGIITSCKKF